MSKTFVFPQVQADALKLVLLTFEQSRN